MSQTSVVKIWLADLSVRCEMRAKENLVPVIDDYAKGLANLNPEVWCEAAREATSQNYERWPSYKALRNFLEKWIEKNCKPKTLLLPPVDDPNLSEEDKSHVRSWINLRPAGNLPSRLRLYRDKWPAAFQYIIRTDAEAEAIAKRHRWINDPVRIQADWGSITPEEIGRKLIELEKNVVMGGVARATAPALLSFLRAAVEKYAPQHLRLIPDRIGPPQSDEPVAAAPPRRNRELTPDELVAVRERAGMNLPRPLGATDPEQNARWEVER